MDYCYKVIYVLNIESWRLFSVVVTSCWWAMVITAAHGENVLFLNLFKDDESSEVLDSNLESDLISTFYEDNESLVFKNKSLNSIEPDSIGGIKKLQPEDLEDEQESSTLKEAANSLQTSQVFEEKTEFHSKHTTNENSHLNTLSKGTVEDESSTSKKFNTVLPERSEELDSFVRFCFDVIAYFIHGVMNGLTSVGDTLASSKPTGESTDYSQSPSRKRKRETETEALNSAESNKDKSFETNVNQTNNKKSAVPDLKIDSGTTLPQHEDSDTSQDKTTSSISKQAIESSTTFEIHNISNEFHKSIIGTGSDSIVSDHLNILDNSSKQKKSANIDLLNKKDVTEIKKNVIGEAQAQLDRTSIPNTPLQEENIGIRTNKKDHDFVPSLNDSSEGEIFNSFLLNDFINKQVNYFCYVIYTKLTMFTKNNRYCRHSFHTNNRQ